MKTIQNFPVGSLVIALVFALTMLISHLLVRPPAPPAELDGVLRSEFRPLAPFNLQTANHGPISEASLRNKWSFVFFGYRSCPDICPLTLHELDTFEKLLRDESAAESNDLQIIFVSVDPDRDTPRDLANYVSYFNPDFIGATAGKGALQRLTQQFGTGYVMAEETAPGKYLIAHSSAIFLVDPRGRLVATFSQPHYASTLLSQYKKITRYFADA